MKYEDICAEVQNGLPLYVGGDLEPSAATDIARHLEGCATCKDRERAARDARKLLVSALALSERRGPDLWPNVRAVLTEDALIRSQPAAPVASARKSRPAWAKYSLAAAAALLAGLWVGRALFEDRGVVGPEGGDGTEIVDVNGSAPVVPVSADALRPVGRFERRLRQDAAIYDGAAIHVEGPWKGLPYDPASATPVLQRGPRTQ
jgi:anti-sigma factor RsiW